MSTVKKLASAFSTVGIIISAITVTSFVKEAEEMRNNYAKADWNNKMEQVRRNLDNAAVDANSVVSSLMK